MTKKVVKMQTQTELIFTINNCEYQVRKIILFTPRGMFLLQLQVENFYKGVYKRLGVNILKKIDKLVN